MFFFLYFIHHPRFAAVLLVASAVIALPTIFLASFDYLPTSSESGRDSARYP